MGNTQGEWTWYELMTSDPDAAAAFYGAVIGWNCQSSGQDGMDYREWWMGDMPIGGLMKTPEGALMPPCWTGYIAVDDIHAGIEGAKGAGATVHMGPQEVPGVGHFAFLSDPQGAMFYIMQDVSCEMSRAFSDDMSRPGHCAWNELSTTDHAGAWTFYGSQFGWSKDGAMDLGEMGSYEFIRQHRQKVVGAIMPKMPQTPMSVWTFFFRVADIDAAAAIVKDKGGHIIAGPMEIPGGDFSAIAIDPQGAVFGLVGARN